MRFRLAKPGTTGTRVYRVRQGDFEERPDELATEEPLEIRLIQGGKRRTVAVTMRTPGTDAELALGFLFAEGVIRGRDDVRRLAPCIDTGDNAEDVAKGESGCANVMEVELADGLAEPELAGLERHFFATSACGVCGKASLDALTVRLSGAIAAGPEIPAAVITALPERLRAAQGMFETTGGLHAAALFDAAGELLAVREDVGRHNALDKLVGWALGEGRLPLAGHVVLVSGRSSYEILQKALMAGVPVVCAVSAPSSLAVELAERFGLTLIGFLRGDRFNVYSGVERVAGAPARNLLPVL